MKVGRIRKDGQTLSVIFEGGSAHSISTIMGVDEKAISDQFYDIILHHEDDLVEAAKGGRGVVPEPWQHDIPVPKVNQIRDFYAFEEHVKAGRNSRGLEMVPEWYEIPVFYYSGTSSLYASGEDVRYPRYTGQLDFELEAAVVIGKEGRDISATGAADHIAGAFLMNDWSARDEQKKEMKLNLGPAKSKDFGTSFGPHILAGRELWDLEEKSGRFDISIQGYVNGRKYSDANLKTMYWGFGDMIERASNEVTLFPGDVIMSGTVGTGCILELGPEKYGWLNRGDTVVFESDALGKLISKVV